MTRKPATPELRQRVLEFKLNSALSLPSLVGVPSPDDVVFQPTLEGYLATYLYHHQAVAKAHVSITDYVSNRNSVRILGKVNTWVVGPGEDEGEFDEDDLRVTLPSSEFDGINL